MALSGSDLAYLQSRAGIARAGAVRSNYVTGLVARVTINGTDRTASILKSSITITQNLNEQVDTCTLRTRGVTGFTPTVGQTISVSLGDASDNLLFGGRIQAVTLVCGNANQGGTQWWELYCTDYTFQASKRLVLKRYVGQSANHIVADLMGTYASSITLNHVQSGLADIDDITFTQETVPNALTRICNRIGGYWYIDYTGDLHLFTTETRPAPDTLSASSTWAWDGLRVRTDLSQIRTRVYVEGAGGLTSENQYILPVPTDEADIAFAGPTFVFNDPSTDGRGNASYTVRVRDTLVLPYSSIESSPYELLAGTAGGATTYAAWKAEGNARLLSGEQVNIWTTRDDTDAQTALAALEGGDGIREYYIQDRRLNQESTETRGDAELDLYGDPLVTVTYRTQDPNARPGSEVTISLSSPLSLSGTYRIQSVSINDLELSTTQWPWRTVTASIVRFDLYDVLRRRQGAA